MMNISTNTISSLLSYIFGLFYKKNGEIQYGLSMKMTTYVCTARQYERLVLTHNIYVVHHWLRYFLNKQDHISRDMISQVILQWVVSSSGELSEFAILSLREAKYWKCLVNDDGRYTTLTITIASRCSWIISRIISLYTVACFVFSDACAMHFGFA